MAHTNQRVLITGGAGDIGTETARRFLAAGARVMLVDINEEDLRTTQQKLDSEHCYIRTADVTKREDVQAYVAAAVEKMGGIDVFFNNAGIEGAVLPIADYPEDVFRKVLDVNVVGVWLGLKYVMPHMRESGGSIIITSSVAGQGGTPNVSAYVTSKHATIGLMRTAALEGAAHQIRVNTVHPSPVTGRMMESLESGFGQGEGAAVREQFQQQIPLQRYAEEADVANLVLFLASDESEFLTGAQFNVDGGMSAK
jgi:NAD(P)-dependent dehydrogenase (short-subunit alcohol dehydrogenase family)